MHANRMPRAAKQCGAHTAEARIFAAQPGHVRSASAPDLDRYDVLARFLHWTFALCIIYASVAGYSLARLPDGPLHAFLSQLNESIGTVLIALFPLRLGWKLIRSEPRAIHGISAWQQSVAHVVHGVIYATIFAVLTSGFLMVPNGYSFLGLFEIHTPFQKGPLTAELFTLHRASCALLAGLVVLHVLAVVKHQLIARNDVLRRML